MRVALLLLVLTFIFCTGTMPEAAQATSNVLRVNVAEPSYEGGTAGVPPVSIEKFTGKINAITSKIYNATKPIIDNLAVIALCIAGFAAMFMVFSGADDMFRRVIGAVFCIGIGLLLYHGAPFIAGLIKGLGMMTN